MAIFLCLSYWLAINRGHSAAHHSVPAGRLKILCIDQVAHTIEFVGRYIDQKVIGGIFS